MRLNSKWSYILCGVNAMVALVGALVHSMPLCFMGGIFTFWNWKSAEVLRSIEDESIRNESDTKE